MRVDLNISKTIRFQKSGVVMCKDWIVHGLENWKLEISKSLEEEEEKEKVGQRWLGLQ